MDLKAEVREAKQSKKSTEEYQELIDEHKTGMEEMQQQLEEEKERMQKKLLEKLKARKDKKVKMTPPRNVN